MHRRFAVVLLAASALAAVFVLPAHAAPKSIHRPLASHVKALRAPGATAQPGKPGSVEVAWTPAPPMPVATAETGGGAAAANFFWTAGGFNSAGSVVNNTQKYNKTTNAWSAGAPIPGAGGGWADAAFCINAADKTLHVVNGHDGSFLYSAHQVYDLLGNTWTFAAPPILSSGDTWFGQDQGCAFIGGKMYLFGGYGIISPSEPAASLETETWVYDPATDTWTDTGKPMITARIWQGYASSTTTAYVAGGIINLTTFTPTNAAEKFTPAGGWVPMPSLPGAVSGNGMGIAGTHLVSYGGDTTGGGAMTNKTIGCTLPACGSWAVTAFNLPAAKGYMSFGGASSVYSTGGFDSSFAVLSSAEHLP